MLGTVAMWLMDGTSPLPSGTGFLLGASPWVISHVADFDGNGKADLIWQLTDGQIALWLMNGLAQMSNGVALLQPPGVLTVVP